MFKKNKRLSLLRYWTSSYLMTLFVGLAIIALISAFWIRHATLENRLDLMRFIAEETVHRVSSTEEPLPRENQKLISAPNRMEMREINPTTYILDTNGLVLTSNRPFEQLEIASFYGILENEEGVEKFDGNDGQSYYAVKREIAIDEKVIGWVLVIESEANLKSIKQQYGQLAIGIIVLALLGWGAIYFLSRRLASPISQVAAAAKQVQEGDYAIDLPEQIKELEVYDLVTSFKEMATRLEQLEKTRTELLAGVTHELKTPVTSISGLLQAVKDGVVTGQEADEFIRMALIETTKMKTMVGDLLTFNTFAVHAVSVQLVEVSVNTLVKNAVVQWEIMQEDEAIQVTTSLLDEDSNVAADVVRVQQILTNLLTNASQAIKENGIIHIALTRTDEFVSVIVKDTGSGIKEEDRPFVFERFYRGENKKYAVRGLGLGLPLSKMMAQSIGGDLQLIESSEQGTTFELMLPKSD